MNVNSSPMNSMEKKKIVSGFKNNQQQLQFSKNFHKHYYIDTCYSHACQKEETLVFHTEAQGRAERADKQLTIQGAKFRLLSPGTIKMRDLGPKSKKVNITLTTDLTKYVQIT